MRQSYFGHDKFAEQAPGMKTLEDALRVRRRIYRAFEAAEVSADPHERARWLTFDARTVLWTAGVEAPPLAAAPARVTGAE